MKQSNFLSRRSTGTTAKSRQCLPCAPVLSIRIRVLVPRFSNEQLTVRSSVRWESAAQRVGKPRLGRCCLPAHDVSSAPTHRPRLASLGRTVPGPCALLWKEPIALVPVVFTGRLDHSVADLPRAVTKRRAIVFKQFRSR